MSAGVAITGLGLACPLATDLEAAWAALATTGAAGDPAPRLVTPPKRRGGIEPPGPAVVFEKPFKAEAFTDRRTVRKASDQARLAAGAAALCLEDAGFPPADADPALTRDTCVVIGTTFGGGDYYLGFHDTVLQKGLPAANAVLFTESVWNAASGHVTAIHGLQGVGHTLIGGEEVGLSALATGADAIRLGQAPAALVGGSDQYTDMVHASLLAEGLVGRDLPGLAGEGAPALCEGGACVLLERADTPRPAYAAVLGGARTRPKPGAEAPKPEALARALRQACAEAETAPEELDLVIGGAASGPQARCEAQALAQLGPGPWAYAAPKAALGEGFAFTSAALVVAACLALARQTVPVTWLGPNSGSGVGLEALAPQANPQANPQAAPQPASLQRVGVFCCSHLGGATAVVLGAGERRHGG